jgi:hypothetical protein
MFGLSVSVRGAGYMPFEPAWRVAGFQLPQLNR